MSIKLPESLDDMTMKANFLYDWYENPALVSWHYNHGYNFFASVRQYLADKRGTRCLFEYTVYADTEDGEVELHDEDFVNPYFAFFSMLEACKNL